MPQSACSLATVPLQYLSALAPDTVVMALASATVDNINGGTTMRIDDIAFGGTATAAREAKDALALSVAQPQPRRPPYRLSSTEPALLAAAPYFGHAGPAPCTPIVAQPKATPAPAQEPAAHPAGQPAGPAAPQLTLQLGPFQLRYAAHAGRPTLLDHLLFRSRVAALARQVASGNGPRLPF